ncbi:EAL domain-containing protein [Noviherbaspirillum denitrificans]|uniref:Diguanylate cyclase n=1 Tax=Noviherbaspirillum denitrificans TaxID=1968433 RepID=A0A254T6T7_9BURK|nr:EAL domain-containing protein [Noviherbaspirillum denitrificans]OWW18305.1 hypothetical protein AYR66_01645 [Noviherbaspirillum denitrificans]
MRRTLEIYRSIAEQAAYSIFFTDEQSRVIYQNPEALNTFGFSDEEISGQRLHDKIHHHHPDGTPVPIEQCKIYRAAVFGETERNFTWLVSRKDGSHFYASCTAAPVFFEGERIGATFFATDITEKKAAEDALARSTEELKLATEAASLGLFDYSFETDELRWTDQNKEHFGLPPEAQASVAILFAQIHPDDRERARQILAAAVKSGGEGRFELEFRTIDQRNGRVRWIVARGRVLFDADGKPTRRIGTTIDATERKQTEKRLLEASQHDSLTGLPNRALLFEYCGHLIAMANRAQTGGGAVLFIDLDRFKPINDLYGHETGDKVLQEVARRLQSCTRKEDIVSRLGGDEFIVVLPRVDSAYGPVTVAENLLSSIGQPIHVGDLQLSVTPSIGISLFPTHSSELETLIRCADLAMYSAKRVGRNNFTIYSPGLDEHANEFLRLEIRLKQALQSNGLMLFYQPIMDVQSGHLAGVEALVRLRDENGQLRSPNDFIPIAESAGLINQLGEWVAAEACRQHERWREAGLPPLSISINISSSQFRQRTFASHLAEAIDRYGIDPACLQVEITESAVMDNLPAAIAALNEIRSTGIRIALDDFGTGYSSLNYLSSLPLDKLKIDQSFIKKIVSHRPSRSITDAILALGRSLNLKVVGEGIESEQAMDYLREHGCDQAQGYLFSHPLPPKDFEAWYWNRARQLH